MSDNYIDDAADIPSALPHHKKSRWSFPVVWLIPLIAVLIGGWLAVKSVMERGPTITIVFKNAEGLEAGKTKLKFKDVEIGIVKTVAISKDLKEVIATAELVKDFGPHLVEDTRFWVVRPRISGGSVSGLGTLLSGSYIGVDAGHADKKLDRFVGLDLPPVVTIDTPGREFVLRSPTLTSLDAGSPVFYRRIQAGQVMSYELDKTGKTVSMKLFINAPYDSYVNANTRFWNASGIDVKLDASGIEIETQSVVSILIGGVAFETPEASAVLPAAAAKTEFALFSNRTAALKNPETESLQLLMVFNESARGLALGAPVDFRGVIVGEVASVNLDVDRKTGQINNAVTIQVYPARMRAQSRQHLAYEGAAKQKELIETMVKRGLRGQLRSGSLLTGQLYVALDFFPKAPAARVDWASAPPLIPTAQGSLVELQQALGSIASKIEKLPLDQIAGDVRLTLQSATGLIKHVDTDVAPDLRQTLQSGTKLLNRLDADTVPEVRNALLDVRKTLASADRLMSSDAPLQADTRDAMRELSRTAQSFRLLADYLEQHPEALLMGKKEGGQ